MTIFGMKRGKMDPMVTETAFIMFMAIVAKSQRTNLFILFARSITMMNVLSPISARKTSMNDYVNPAMKRLLPLEVGVTMPESKTGLVVSFV